MTWAATWAELVAKPDRGLRAIANIGAAEQLTSWSLSSGKTITYETTPTQRYEVHGPKAYTSVMVDGPTELTSRASIALVEANPGSFYWDGTKLYVSYADSSEPWLHTTVAGFTLYVCTASPIVPGYFDASAAFPYSAPAYLELDGNLYWPRLANVAAISRRLSEVFDPRVITGSTRVSIVAGADWDAIFRAYLWHNRTVEILIGGEGLPYSEYQPVFTGKTRDYAWSEPMIELEVADDTHGFNSSFPPDKITAEMCSTDYTFHFIKQDAVTVVKSPESLNANAATTITEIGAPIPFVAGRDIYRVSGRMLSIGTGTTLGNHIEAIGKGVRALAVVNINSSTGVETLIEWTGDGAGGGLYPSWYVDRDNGLVYYVGGTGARTLEWILHGPDSEDDGVSTFPGGPSQESAPEIIKRAVTLQGLDVTWDDDALDDARFFASLFELQVYERENKTLREIIDKVCRSTGMVVYCDESGRMVVRSMAPDYRNYTDLDEAWGDFLDWSIQVEHANSYTACNVEWGALTEQAFTAGVTSFTHKEACPEYAAEGASDRTLDIRDTYLKTEAGAVALALRAIRWSANAPMKVRMKTTMRHLQLGLGSTVRIVKARKPAIDSSYTLFMVVIGIGINVQEGTIDLDLVEKISARQAYISAASSPAFGSATADQKRIQGFVTDDDGLAAAANNAAYKISQEW